ncbi:IS110 family transposase [Micromonospora sp. WMMD1274]|uniref:IS110 family transposase n=1 Tax=Micromonospora sp. WMMD1274 TaxID=3404116 RepID=UPI003B95D523
MAVIAHQARMRVDLREPLLEDTLLAELRMLTAHRAGLAADHTRTIDRLRVRLRGFIPALERRVDFTNRGPLVLISQLQTTAALIAAGRDEVQRLLRERTVRHADKLATAARQAAGAQHVPGEEMAGESSADLRTT